MTTARRFYVALFALVMIVLGACSATHENDPSDDEEAIGRQSQALEGGASDANDAGDASGCRRVDVTASKSYGPSTWTDFTSSPSPPLRFALPAKARILAGNAGNHWITFGYRLESGALATCRYKGGASQAHPNSPSQIQKGLEYLFESCTSGATAGTTVTADFLSLHVDNGDSYKNPTTVTIALDESPPCAGSDAGGATDAAVDAAVDSGPACSAETCTSPSPCVVAQCQSGACVQTPAAAGTGCATGSACSTGMCSGAGSCIATPIVLPPAGPCTTVTCDPVLGVVTTPQPDGTSCSNGDACVVGQQCSGGACTGGAARTCTASGPCVQATCNSATGCVETPRAAGTTCDPAPNVCLGLRTCNASGACVQASPLDCSSSDRCLTTGCSPVTGCTSTRIPGCDSTPIETDEPYETRASLVAKVESASGTPLTSVTFTVYDERASGTPRSDVVVTSNAPGVFRIKLASFPASEPDRSPPHRLMVLVDSPSTLRAFREVYAHPGDSVDLGTIRLVARDPRVTVIGPEGGVARDSNSLVEISVPPGALATATPIQITPFLTRDDFNAPLPPNSLTGYGFEAEPSGTTFAVPVTVRTTNYRNLPTSLPLPMGTYDEVEGRWVSDGLATWDGSRFAGTVTSFSPKDYNFNDQGELVLLISTGGNPNKGGANGGICGSGSTYHASGGSMDNVFPLPGTRTRSEDLSLSLHYSSGLAGPRKITPKRGTSASTPPAALPTSSLAITAPGTVIKTMCVARGSQGGPSGGPGTCSASAGGCAAGAVSFAGKSEMLAAQNQQTFAAEQNARDAAFGGWISLPLGEGGAVPAPGLVTQTISLGVAGANGVSCGGSGTFGVSDPLAQRAEMTTDSGPMLQATRKVLLHHRFTSSFGAGWAIREMSRLFVDGDHAVLVNGEGQEEDFRPRARVSPLPDANGEQVFTRDEQTGELFVASAPGTISSLDPVTAQRSPVMTGLAFPSETFHALAVAYVGGVRHFIVAFSSRVLDVGAGGATRQLATRAVLGAGANSAYLQAALAARGDKVFYTAGDIGAPVLYRIDLAQPAPAPVALSRAAVGGDERLFPKSPLSGVRFGHPLGLAFGPTGILYIADARRHGVYAVFPDAAAGGAISTSSSVALVLGDGRAKQIMPPGEAQPALAFAINQPMRLSMADDGRLLVMNGYGITSFDPQAREAETLLLDRGLDEIPQSLAGLQDTNPPFPFAPASFVALSSTSFFSRTASEGAVRVDVERLGSELDPMRTAVKLGDQIELTDRNAGLVWRCDARSGRLLEQKKRTGETDFTVTYKDARRDAIDRVTNAVGGQWVFGYAANGKVSSITDPAGGVTTFQINGQGDLESFAEPDGEGHSFTYDLHHMTSKRTSRGDLTTYDFADDGTVAASHKPGNENFAFDPVNVVAATYDASGNGQRTGGYTDSHGVHHDLVLDTFGQIDRDTYVADGVSRRVESVHPETLVGALDPFVSRRNNTIRRTSHRTLNGINLSPPLTFDSRGRPVRQIPTGGGAADELHHWVYDNDGWLYESFDGPSSIAQRYDRDSAGHVTRIFDVAPGSGNTPTGRETTFTLRADGQPQTMTTHGVTTTFAYDDAGGSRNLTSTTDTLGRTLLMTYDFRGNVSAVTDGTALSSFLYDANNRLLESRDGLSNVTTLRYTHAGCGCTESDLVTGIHTPDLPAGVEWTMAYGAQGRVASVTDPHGFTESYTYAPTGELTGVTDRLLRTTTMSHDALGRVAAIVDTLGRKHAKSYTVPTSSGWSGATLTAASADATTAATSLSTALRSGDYQIGLNAFQAEGYPAQISFYRDATFALGYTSYFDAGSRLTFRADRTTRAFDSDVVPATRDPGAFAQELLAYEPRSSASLLNGVSSPRPPASSDGLFSSRDLELDVTSTEGFGGGIESVARYTYTRDAGGRVTARAHRFSTALLASEPIAHASFDAVTTTYAYRPDGRVGSVRNVDGATGTSTLTFSSNLTTRDVSTVQGEHAFTYDARGLVATQTDFDGTYRYAYDEVGRNTRLEYPDGHARVQVFDDLGRISSRCYRYTSGALDRCYSAEYDAVGNPVRLVDPEGSDELAYDTLDRLTRLTRKDSGGALLYAEEYAYNALGALRTHAGVAVDHQRPRLSGGGLADAAVPATFRGSGVNLDLGGRVTLLGGNTFGWDHRGQQRRISSPDPVLTA